MRSAKDLAAFDWLIGQGAELIEHLHFLPIDSLEIDLEELREPALAPASMARSLSCSGYLPGILISHPILIS